MHPIQSIALEDLVHLIGVPIAAARRLTMVGAYGNPVIAILLDFLLIVPCADVDIFALV